MAVTVASAELWLESTLNSLMLQWDLYSIIIVMLITGYMGYAIFTTREPDIHPMILARQASVSRVRKSGESAVYRATDTPEGFPLRAGLNVRYPSDPPYFQGRDGDIRSIWRKVKGEVLTRSRAPPPPKGKQVISTVLGKEQVIDHNVDELTKEIEIIGHHLATVGAKRVAIYLPNSVELLSSLFATSFFGISIIFVPFNQPHPLVVEFLQQTKADSLIAAAGSLPLDMITSGTRAIKSVTWVVEPTSRHMDWTEVPAGLGGKLDVSVWHELVQDHSGSPTPVPDLETKDLGTITMIWQNENLATGQSVEFTQANFIAAVASLMVALPFAERVQPTDLVLPADSLTNAYTLSQILVALWSGASVALTSVAGPEANLAYATKNITPTIVIATAESASRLHAESSPAVQSGLGKLAHSSATSELAGGNMPSSSVLTTMSGNTRALLGSSPDKLRLVYIVEKAGSTNPPVSSRELSDLRVFTGAHVVYALTAPAVAGAVAQTIYYDYRVHEDGNKTKHSHFGGPMSSLEIKLVDKGSAKTTDDCPQGEIIVSGPSVASGQANLGILGTFRPDCTLAYI